jgi:hypothetical protein
MSTQALLGPFDLSDVAFIRDRLKQLARYTAGSESAARMENIAGQLDSILNPPAQEQSNERQPEASA